MTNILFSKNAYYNLATQIRGQYENIGDDVYALRSQYFNIDIGDLPKWLSIDQYNKVKRLVPGYYNMVTRGFNSRVISLMELTANVSRGVRSSFASIPIPKNTVITEETFYRLNPSDKVKYQKIVRDGKTLYVTKVPTVNIMNVAKSPVRPPTVGTSKIPIGRWVEVY